MKRRPVTLQHLGPLQLTTSEVVLVHRSQIRGPKFVIGAQAGGVVLAGQYTCHRTGTWYSECH
ncbi:uncharacterized protein BDR25DRAFT_356320 [Lindgomyces ingoldianus]|uniref:Uncharacterized protein n=1 Tax=Lindgomyces ingoldianus TaxID=673940 RepID=A0ACB6QRS4_9PLEO|nr:uncharacterized protein BDR25DRAFT_356320 [Lindgomyces ingoldianus]KAF2469590.1 hypothetical protein BDR25DRAFT_356320 [Lindgomyces ingoldianus]